MKNIIILFICVLTVSSCSDFLEEDLSAQITSESGALKNEKGLIAALAGTYKPLTYTWNSGLGNSSTQAVLMGGDDLTTHKAANKADFREFDQFKVAQQNGRLPFVWSGAYKSIQGSNNIIANYEDATGDASVIQQIAGEAFFLRAYNYFWIVRLWGEAPLVLNTHVFDEEILTVESSSVAAIYEQIIADLTMAESLLSDTKPAPGRVNKGAAMAVLAEVYLNMAGWPLNDASKYEMAASKAKEVIDNQTTYGFGLMENFADLWMSENDGNSEEVFALNFWAGDWYNGNAVYGSPARPSDEGGWDDYFAEITFFNEFPEDARKPVTFMTELADGTPWQEFTTAHPYYKKLQGPDNDWLNAISLPLERLAEVYMVYAEAQVMATSNPSDPSALEAVNKIVRRANGLPLNTPAPSVDWTSATQEQIVQEKAWEFAAEYTRWFDLVRLQMVEDVIAKKHPDDLQPLGPVQYQLPLPASETLANPNLGD
uniref:RagB/SusD family nutrient uptake outer membrane protein n=1 Tax=Roseihalotalea indica TaxID=2867963 RepID=A0AA49JEV4_9BACT|nr:RagB/SusD family nutrient uptake outer membrane protein [Tunicatimonas sp. TK19036]